jgi:hypothetical protein
MSNGLNATGVDTTDAPFTSIAPREDRTGDGWVSRRVTTNGVVSVGCLMAAAAGGKRSRKRSGRRQREHRASADRGIHGFAWVQGAQLARSTQELEHSCTERGR